MPRRRSTERADEEEVKGSRSRLKVGSTRKIKDHYRAAGSKQKARDSYEADTI